MKRAALALCFALAIPANSYAQSYWEDFSTNPQTYTSGNVGIGGLPAGNTRLHVNASGNNSLYGAFIYNSGATDLLGGKFGLHVMLNDSAPAVPNYGIYSSVPVGNTYWAGYFLGNGHFSGNVGIGTGDVTAPATDKLMVWNGNVVIGSPNNKFVLHHQWWNSGSNALHIAPWSSTLNDWNFANGITMQNDGLVKMKNVEVAETLKVNEKVWAKAFEVKLPPFPDYVFTPGYDLLPIDSVAAYINANGHLPGLPPAQTIDKAEGYDVGNLLVKQMEKIEELTLYIIELKAEIDWLKKNEAQAQTQH